MSHKGQPPAKDYIPVGPIRRVLWAIVDQRQAELGPVERGGAKGAEETHLGALASVANDIYDEDTEQGKRYVGRVLRESTWIRFDTADLILTRLGLSLLWREDPELSEIYQSDVVRLADERAARLAAA
jgi:hypothetical protein